MAYRVWIIIILFILAFIFLSPLIFFPITKEGEPARLGFIGERKPSCTGELSLTSQALDGKCGLTASVELKNCEGKRWYVFKGNECRGILVCDGDVRVPLSRWRCEWEDDRGTYTLTLCADVDKKASSSLTC